MKADLHVKNLDEFQQLFSGESTRINKILIQKLADDNLESVVNGEDLDLIVYLADTSELVKIDIVCADLPRILDTNLQCFIQHEEYEMCQVVKELTEKLNRINDDKN